MTSVTDALTHAGFSGDGVRAKVDLFALAESAMEHSAAPARWFVPGRIEVLGKHTDYAGGRSLLAAVDRGFAVVATPRRDHRVRIVDAVQGLSADLALDPHAPSPEGHWTAYPAAVLRRVARNFDGARTGVNISFASDLPPASGMSSSSALLIATYFAVAHASDLETHPAYRATITSRESLAAYLATIENGRSFGNLVGDDGGSIGVYGGSEDHTAILCCSARQLSQYSFAPVSVERIVPFPRDRVFVVAYSGVAAAKGAAARDQYNTAALCAREIVSIWNDATGRADGTLANAIMSDAAAVDEIRAVLARSSDRTFSAAAMLDRFEQFHRESFDFVPQAAQALASGDYATFGDVVHASQENAERLLGNQIPETVGLVRSARALGADAASAFGAGYGGSVWAMVRYADAETFTADWRQAYTNQFERAAKLARFMITMPGPSAFRL